MIWFQLVSFIFWKKDYNIKINIILDLVKMASFIKASSILCIIIYSEEISHYNNIEIHFDI